MSQHLESSSSGGGGGQPPTTTTFRMEKDQFNPLLSAIVQPKPLVAPVGSLTDEQIVFGKLFTDIVNSLTMPDTSEDALRPPEEGTKVTVLPSIERSHNKLLLPGCVPNAMFARAFTRDGGSEWEIDGNAEVLTLPRCVKASDVVVRVEILDCKRTPLVITGPEVRDSSYTRSATE